MTAQQRRAEEWNYRQKLDDDTQMLIYIKSSASNRDHDSITNINSKLNGNCFLVKYDLCQICINVL